MAGEGLGRVRSKILDPFAQLRVMYAKIVRGLRYRHTTILDQLHSLKLDSRVNFRLPMTHLLVL